VADTANTALSNAWKHSSRHTCKNVFYVFLFLPLFAFLTFFYFVNFFYEKTLIEKNIKNLQKHF